MANVKISELPAANNVGSSDLIAIVQGGITKRATANMFSGSGSGSSSIPLDIVNVKDYGAKGDNSTDDTNAVKSAIAAVAARNITGDATGIVYFPPGAYLVSTALAVPRNIFLQGEGGIASKLQYNGSSTLAGPFVTFGTSGNINTYGGVRRMQISANAKAPTTILMYGPQEGATLSEAMIVGATNATVDIRASGIYGGTNKFVIEKCWIWGDTDNFMYGVKMDAGGGPNAIRDTTIVATSRSYQQGGPAGSAAIYAIGCTIEVSDVNCEHFDAFARINATNFTGRLLSTYYTNLGIVIEYGGDAGKGRSLYLQNVTFDGATACLRDYQQGGSATSYVDTPFFVSYEAEGYRYDQRNFRRNTWQQGAVNIIKTDTRANGARTQLGYDIPDLNGDLTNFKFGTLTQSNGWKQSAYIDNSSGNVVFPAGWNDSHLQIGGYHLWVDGNGRLRIKSSAPTSDTDGSVVGSQS